MPEPVGTAQFNLDGTRRLNADALLDQMPVTDILNGDKGYDSDAVRRKIESKGAAPNIPP